jgi:DNA-directed RNA polymerase specialized sigma54-like protein
VQSEFFAQRTESNAVGDTLTEFIKRLLDENEKLERENRDIEWGNTECQRRLQSGEIEGLDRDGIVDEWGKHITDFEIRSKRMRVEEKHIQKREKLFERDYQDLLEYIKWISADLSLLRDRARIAEKIISDLKQSGEESVDSLMGTLSHNKRR